MKQSPRWDEWWRSDVATSCMYLKSTTYLQSTYPMGWIIQWKPCKISEIAAPGSALSAYIYLLYPRY